jgi:hypothetical protein
MSMLARLRVTLPSLRPWLTGALTDYRRFRPDAQVDLEQVTREADRMARDLVWSDLRKQLGDGPSVRVMMGASSLKVETTPQYASLPGSLSDTSPNDMVRDAWVRARDSTVRRCIDSHMPV